MTSARLRERGFTIIEVLSVLLIISIVVRIALPKLHDVRVRADAAAVVADFAAETYYSDHNTWPADLGPGITPPELESDLFDFERGKYRLDWENWSLPGGLPDDPNVQRVIGISMRTTDAALGAAVLGMINDAAAYQLGDTYTFIFQTG